MTAANRVRRHLGHRRPVVDRHAADHVHEPVQRRQAVECVERGARPRRGRSRRRPPARTERRRHSATARSVHRERTGGRRRGRRTVAPTATNAALTAVPMPPPPAPATTTVRSRHRELEAAHAPWPTTEPAGALARVRGDGHAPTKRSPARSCATRSSWPPRRRASSSSGRATARSSRRAPTRARRCSTPTRTSWRCRPRPASCTRRACGARSLRCSKTSRRRHATGRRLRAERSVPRRHPRQRHPGVPARSSPTARLVAGCAYFAGTLIHVADVGGVAAGGLAALATDTFVEGLLLPPVLLARDGEPATDVLRIIARNSRTPDKVVGDVQALVAGVHAIGASRRRTARALRRHQRRPRGATGPRRLRTADARVLRRAPRRPLRELVHDRHRRHRRPHLRRARRGDAAGRRHRRHRPRGDVRAGTRRDQRVGVADARRASSSRAAASPIPTSR